ncbi:MAG TPA: AAA family ATPase [Solirubrobacteraceae bacterium]|jgi:ATP-dependent Zn protease|nr:AAA family ATPase [Solirubrobacteraceae bacterium]
MRGPLNPHASALAYEWRRLTRAATFVALLTAPAFFLILYDSDHWSVVAALIVTVLAVLLFRGLVEVLARRLIPSPSLFGSEELKADDIVARRRYWYWRSKFRRLPIYVIIVFALLGLCQAFFAFAGISAGFFHPFSGLRQIFPADTLPQLGLIFVQLPLLFFVNFAIFFGPFLFFAVRQIRGYEPGDASWGVKIDDVRGQAEAKEEITRVITLWQSGEEFEKAGGKRERGLLFLGAPGTGKTMISKAIATNFNCPFVTIPGSGFAGMFIGMDAITVQFLARKARKLARKWGGQCIVFIDEIDAVGMRRQALGSGMTANASAIATDEAALRAQFGALVSSGDVTVESREWRDWMFEQRAERVVSGYGAFVERVQSRIQRLYPGFGMGGGMGGQALNQLLVVMDGIDEPPVMRKFLTNRINTFLDAMFVVPTKIGGVSLRLAPPSPRPEQIYFIGACNVPIMALDPALIRPGRMGRHIWFRTPTKDDRADIFDLYLDKVDHEPDLDSERRRDELARITSGYSPSMIEQCCSMALTIAHSEGRRVFGWLDIVEAMTTVETGTAQNIEYVPEESKAVAIHEAGHAVAGHIYMEKEVLSTRLSIRKRGGSLGHYQSMEREERFSRFRSTMIGTLIMKLGAMASEHVFYNENTGGVSHDVETATQLAAMMVGAFAMGPAPIHINGEHLDDEELKRVTKRLERIGTTIMNRSSGSGMFTDNPLGAVLGDREKRAAAAQILGQAYVSAYALMRTNRDAVEQIADALVERKEIYGDEVTALLNSVNLQRPKLDLTDDSTWPTV